jgi:hypothetical protein
MRDPKETMKAEDARTNPTAAKGAEAAKETAKLEYCHGSVCLGNKKPTHCICPTEKK